MKEIYCLEPVFPRKVMIEVSNVCNHDCIFCANSFSSRKRGLIDDELIMSVISELGERKVEELSFHGMGEPFTNPNLYKYIKYAKDKGVNYVYIDTNGGLATPEKVDRAIGAGLDSIKVSLSAADRETFKIVQGRDDFDNVISNFEYIIKKKELNPQLKVYLDFVKLTINDGQDIVLKERYNDKITGFWVSDVQNQGGNMAGKIEQYYVKTPDVWLCEEPFSRLNITKDGLVSACCMDNDNSLILGDLSKDNMDEIWSSDKAKYIRNALISGENLPEKCRLCDMRKVYQDICGNSLNGGLTISM